MKQQWQRVQWIYDQCTLTTMSLWGVGFDIRDPAAAWWKRIRFKRQETLEICWFFWWKKRWDLCWFHSGFVGRTTVYHWLCIEAHFCGEKHILTHIDTEVLPWFMGLPDGPWPIFNHRSFSSCFSIDTASRGPDAHVQWTMHVDGHFCTSRYPHGYV